MGALNKFKKIHSDPLRRRSTMVSVSSQESAGPGSIPRLGSRSAAHPVVRPSLFRDGRLLSACGNLEKVNYGKLDVTPGLCPGVMVS